MGKVVNLSRPPTSISFLDSRRPLTRSRLYHVPSFFLFFSRRSAFCPLPPHSPSPSGRASKPPDARKGSPACRPRSTQPTSTPQRDGGGGDDEHGAPQWPHIQRWFSLFLLAPLSFHARYTRASLLFHSVVQRRIRANAAYISCADNSCEASLISNSLMYACGQDNWDSRRMRPCRQISIY